MAAGPGFMWVTDMPFRTAVKPLNGYRGLVDHSRPVLLVGSCFTDNVGAMLMRDLFDAEVNPVGPLYNPLSIERFLAMATGELPATPRICGTEGAVHSFDAHSRLTGRTASDTDASLHEALSRTRVALAHASAVMITLGTTRVFTLRDDGLVVANCHKEPAGRFEERNLSVEDTEDALDHIVRMIKGASPEAVVVFTVSPLRYPGRDTHDNTMVKSTLHVAVGRILARYPDDTIYFPSYEIMMDDLRDYRFYADDMRHPSDRAVEYIYGIFGQSFFTDPTMETALRARRLTRRLSHRVSHASSPTDDIHSLPEADILRQSPALERALQRFLNQ